MPWSRRTLSLRKKLLTAASIAISAVIIVSWVLARNGQPMVEAPAARVSKQTRDLENRANVGVEQPDAPALGRDGAATSGGCEKHWLVAVDVESIQLDTGRVVNLMGGTPRNWEVGDILSVCGTDYVNLTQKQSERWFGDALVLGILSQSARPVGAASQ